MLISRFLSRSRGLVLKSRSKTPYPVPFLIFASLILAFSLISSSFAGEPEPGLKTVDATGVSSVSGGNAALARDAAVDDALRKAVEEAVGTFVSADTMVENFQVLKDSIYTRTEGYIKGYTVINESQTPGIYQVSVRATVAVGNIKNDLDAIGLLHARAEKPRVLFLMAEQNIGHKYYVFWWWGGSEYRGETVDLSVAETTLKEEFLKKGFNVVDVSGSLGSIDIANSLKVADLTDDGARQIGRKLNAEVVVKGKAMAHEGPSTPGSSVSSYISDVTAQAIRVDNGALLASAKGHGAARHVSEVSGGSEAITRASEDIAGKLMDQILSKWSAGANLITVRISGVSDYRKIADFKNIVKKQIRGVVNVYQRRFEGAEAVFEIEAKIPASQIADDLSRLPGVRLQVNNTSQNTIDATLIEQ